MEIEGCDHLSKCLSILTSVSWISESLRLDISGLEGIFILAAAALDKELELAVVSLKFSGVK